MKPRGPEHLKEKHIMQATQDYLRAEGIPFLRINSGMAWKGKFPMRLAPIGTPDILVELPAGRAVRDPETLELQVANFSRPVWIEAKKPIGGRLRPEQGDFIRERRQIGGIVLVIRDVERLRYLIPPRLELNFHGQENSVAVGVLTGVQSPRAQARVASVPAGWSGV